MRYNSFDDVLDSDDIMDIELPEERDFTDSPVRDYDYDHDDTDYDPYYERDSDVAEYTEWQDYDPDC